MGQLQKMPCSRPYSLGASSGGLRDLETETPHRVGRLSHS